MDKEGEFQARILRYWDEHGRRDLPWRQTQDPWRLLVAEVLLRKTTSRQATVVFAVLGALSPLEILSMSEQKLEEILQPIGLSRVRAHELRAVAREVVNASPAELQKDEFLRSLPGIGRYISSSIRCVAFGQPEPALDTNMIRVLERVFDWRSSQKRAREDRQFWEFARTLVPICCCKEYNWAVLDLGATICTHLNPKCPECPLRDICVYYARCSTTT